MYKQGEILIVPFPFSDLSSVKRRPVLVISKNLDNKTSYDLIVAGITSKLKDKKHSVLIDNSNLEKGEIPAQSMIKVNKLFSIEQSIVVKKVANINKEALSKVKKEFYSLI